MRNLIDHQLFSDIDFHQMGDFPMGNHVTDLIKCVIEKYLNIRLHFLLKNSMAKTNKRQLLNKYILFQGK